MLAITAGVIVASLFQLEAPATLAVVSEHSFALPILITSLSSAYHADG